MRYRYLQDFTTIRVPAHELASQMVSDAAVLVLLGDWGILRTHNLVRDLLIIFIVSLAFFAWILRPEDTRWRRRGRADERIRQPSQPAAPQLQRDDERRPSRLVGSTRCSPDHHPRRAFEPEVSPRGIDASEGGREDGREGGREREGRGERRGTLLLREAGQANGEMSAPAGGPRAKSTRLEESPQTITRGTRPPIVVMATRSHEILSTVSRSDHDASAAGLTRRLRSKSWGADLVDERGQLEYFSSLPRSTPTPPPDADDTVAKAIERMVSYSRRSSLPSGETPTMPIARRDANGSLPTSAPPTTPISGMRPKPARAKKPQSSGTLFYAQVIERTLGERKWREEEDEEREKAERKLAGIRERSFTGFTDENDENAKQDGLSSPRSILAD